MRAGSNWRHLNGLSLGMMGDPVRCLPKVVHADVAALKLQHNLFDLSRDGIPEPVAVLHAPSAPRSSLTVSQQSDGTTLLAGIGRANLQVFDVTNPAAPAKTADFDTPGECVGRLAPRPLGLRGRRSRRTPGPRPD